MRNHLLAVFSPHCCRAPIGLESPTAARKTTPFISEDTDELKRQCSDTLEQCKTTHKAGKTVQRGENGFAFEAGLNTHFANKSGVWGILSGEITNWPGIDVVEARHSAFVRGEPEDPTANDASLLLEFYETFRMFAANDALEAALSSLSRVQGQFAWVIYDEEQQRVLAARDAAGTSQLHWGVTPDGRFLFGNDPSDLHACNPTATQFPAGSLYASESGTRAVSPGHKGWVIAGEPWPGQLLSFVHSSASPDRWRGIKAIPRIDSKGCMNGAVFRVASEQNLATAATR